MGEEGEFAAKQNELMDVAESSAKGGMYLFLGNILSTGILVGSIITGRLLGPANYGLFSLALVVPSLLIGLMDFGVTSAIIRFSAKFNAEGKHADVKRIIRVGILFELLVGIAAFLFCFLFSSSLSSIAINRPEAGFYVRVASFAIVFNTLFNALSAAFIGLERMKANSLVGVIRSVSKAVLTPFLIIVGLGVFGALIGQILSYVVGVVAGLSVLVFVLHEIRSDTDKSTPGLFKTVLKFGIPIYLSALIGLISSQYQTIVLAFFTSNTEIGNFQVTLLFEAAIALVSYPFIALFPAFSKLSIEDGQINQFFHRSVKYVSMLMIPAAVVIAALAKDFIYALYGTAYMLAPAYLAFYILYNLYTVLGFGVFTYLFNGIGRTDVPLKSNLLSFLIFLPLAPLLTFLFGVMGLIGSFFICNLALTLYFLAMTRKLVKSSPDFRISAKILIVTGLASAVLIAFLLISRFNPIPNLIFGIIIFSFAYLTFMPLLGVITATDLEIFNQLFNKIRTIRFILKVLIAYETKILEYKQKHKL